MIKNLFRITLINFIWKRYAAIIVTTLCLFIYFWLVGKLHADFVAYSELNNDKEYLGLSFVIKWAAFLVGVIVYLLINTRFRNPKNFQDTSEAGFFGTLKTSQNNKTAELPARKNDIGSTAIDPFENIRKKQKLRSMADFIIEENKNEEP
ncbi:MAG: hypothetical protein HOM55_02440 [Proteobacteria bacterium]|jgi:hypothetical protein|nr:hypothetical protein [Pseudomonadota bacterium]